LDGKAAWKTRSSAWPAGTVTPGCAVSAFVKPRIHSEISSSV
jgi:hypothetical protein